MRKLIDITQTFEYKSGYSDGFLENNQIKQVLKNAVEILQKENEQLKEENEQLKKEKGVQPRELIWMKN